jgi:hypothetical protein
LGGSDLRNTLTLAHIALSVSGSWVPSAGPNRRWLGEIRGDKQFATLVLVSTRAHLRWAKSEVAGPDPLPILLDLHPLSPASAEVQFIFIAGDGWVQDFRAHLPQDSYLPSASPPPEAHPGHIYTVFHANDATPPAIFQVLFLARDDVTVGRTGVWRIRKNLESLVSSDLLLALRGGRTGCVESGSA